MKKVDAIIYGGIILMLFSFAIMLRSFREDYDRLSAAVEELQDCSTAIQVNCEHEWEGGYTITTRCTNCGIWIAPQISEIAGMGDDDSNYFLTNSDALSVDPNTATAKEITLQSMDSDEVADLKKRLAALEEWRKTQPVWNINPTDPNLWHYQMMYDGTTILNGAVKDPNEPSYGIDLFGEQTWLKYKRNRKTRTS